MNGADGTVTAKVVMDNSELYQDLRKTEREIRRLEGTITRAEEARSPLIEQAERLRVKVSQARAEVDELNAKWKRGELAIDTTDSQGRLAGLQEEYNGVLDKIEKYDQQILTANAGLEKQEQIAAGIQEQLSEQVATSSQLGAAVDDIGKRFDRVTNRIKRLASRVLFFSVITMGLRSIRRWLGDTIKANSEASAALARLRGAFLTLAQPLLQLVIPALTAVVKALTAVVSAAAQLFSMLTGKTVDDSKAAAKALDGQADAYSGVGKAAKDASKSMASFDELNVLSSDTGGGGGGGGAAAGGADFGFDSDMTFEQLDRLRALVELIGSGFLAWRIGSKLGLGLGKIALLAGGIYSTVELVRAAFGAWRDGVNWDNLIRMLLSAASAATLFGLALGKPAAAVSLLASGFIFLATAFHDVLENGWNLQNLLLSIAGIMAGGLGISILTGSWIPALLAGIASIVLAITVAYGEGENLVNGFKMILDGFLTFFAGVFTGNIDKAVRGIGMIFDGLRQSIGSVLSALVKMFNGFFDFVDDLTDGRLRALTALVRGLITGLLSWIDETIGNGVEALKTILTGIITFLTGVFTNDWGMAWDGIKNVVIGVLELVCSAYIGFLNFFVKIANALVDAVNKISFDVPDWVPELGGKHFGFNIDHIDEFKFRPPALAMGAVIPPNREFLAVLGDQKQGTNIEAPLDTIVQAFRQVMMERGGRSGNVTVVLELDRREFGRAVVDAYNLENQRVGVQLKGVR